jgi:hypothetical protein
VQVAQVSSATQPRVAGTVHNVVARLPGWDSSRSVLLVAHYDTVAIAAGAADDGGGVAALLETARALREGPLLRNDVVFLFTDGEERGLMGARAFLRDDPWAYGVGLVLNFDSPGSSSPALMYETSPRNGLLVREFVAVAPHPSASSLMYEVSRRLPIESDFRPFLAAGVPGMSFGALDGPAYDHTANDSLEHFDEASLQHEGETALALARHFGARDLWDLHRPDVVYFDIMGGVAVVYPFGLVLPFVGLAAAAFVAAAVVAARRRLLTWRGVLLGAAGSLATLGVALFAMGLVWSMYRTAYEQRTWTDTGVVLSDLHRLGLVLLAAALITAVYGLLLRGIRAWDLAFAALGWWVVAAVVVAATVPGAAYLLTWPLLAASLGLLAATWLGERAASTFTGVLVTLAGAAPGVILVSSATYLLLMSAGLKQVATLLAVWLAAGLLVLPLAAVRTAFGRWWPLTLAVVSLVVLMTVGSTVAFDAGHPKFASISYRIDRRGQASWQTVDRVNVWTRQFLPDRARIRFGSSYFPQLGVRTTTTSAAPPLALPRPRLRLLSDTVEGDRRTVRLRLSSPRGAPVVSLLLHSTVGILTADVDGQTLGGKDTTILDGTSVRWSFDYHGLPRRGVVVTLRCAAGKPLLLSAVDFSYGMPAQLAGQYDERPGGMLPGRIGDGVLTESGLRLDAQPAAAR